MKKKETLVVIFLVFLSIVIRIPVVLIFGDTNLENEWTNGYLQYIDFIKEDSIIFIRGKISNQSDNIF